MKFEINNTEWTIKEVSEDTMKLETDKDYVLGLSIYKTQEILILKNQANKIKTLIHELTHAWLYENGHSQKEDKDFGYESICEIVASSNDFINKIVKKYIEKGEANERL